MIKPIKDNILCTIVDREHVTSAGIVLSEKSVKEQPIVCVVAVGPWAEAVEVGQNLIVRDAEKFTYEGEDYVIFPEGNVIAIL